jgi:hypothetical protein
VAGYGARQADRRQQDDCGEARRTASSSNILEISSAKNLAGRITQTPAAPPAQVVALLVSPLAAPALKSPLLPLPCSQQLAGWRREPADPRPPGVVPWNHPGRSVRLVECLRRGRSILTPASFAGGFPAHAFSSSACAQAAFAVPGASSVVLLLLPCSRRRAAFACSRPR